MNKPVLYYGFFPTVKLVVCPVFFIIVAVMAASSNNREELSFTLERFDGQLSNNNIHCMAQDTTGFLWIGTSYGLNKYDGNKITTYLHSPDNARSIADNYINNLYVDRAGSLWIVTPMHLCKYDEEKDNFVNYMYTSEIVNTQTTNPGCIVEDSVGNLWIGTPDKGLFKFYKKENRLLKIDLFVGGIRNMYLKNDEKELWVCGVGEINRYCIKNDEITRYELPFLPVIAIDFDKSLIFTSQEIYCFDIENRFQPKRHKSVYGIGGYYKSLMFNAKDHVLIGTKGDGILIIDKQKKEIRNLKFEKNNYNSIRNNTINCIFQDNLNNIWIGSNDGINIIRFPKNKFHAYLKEDGLISDIITSQLIDRDENLWISTFEGFSIKKKNENEFENFSTIRCNGKLFDCLNMRDLTMDSKGNVWLGKRENLFVFEKDKNIYRHIELPYKYEGCPDVLCTYADNDSSVWIGTYGNGVYEVNINKYHVVQHFDQDNSSISSNYIKDIVKLKDGNLCIATLRSGVDIYNPRTGTINNIQFKHLTGNYSSNSINCVFQDSKGYIWVLSWFGCFILDENYKVCKTLTEENSSISSELTAINKDADDNIWIGTSNGLLRITITTDSVFYISNYNTADGLISNNVCTGGVYPYGDTLYVGTSNGMVYFSIKDIPVIRTSTQPVITGLKIFNKNILPGEMVYGAKILDRQIHLTDNIELNHKHKTVSIEFSTTDYSSNKHIKYAYKLDGLDQDWIYATNYSSSANYSNLAPGNYTFRVKLENSNGFWSDEKKLNIKVYPPIWKTWWAYLLYILVVIFIIYAIFNFILSKEKLKQELIVKQIRFEKENEIGRLKIKFFTSISHDIRTPLTLIIAPLEHIIKSEGLKDSVVEQLKIVNKNAHYLLSLINQLLDFRKMEVEENNISVSNNDIVAFVKQTTLAFVPYAKQKNITLHFSSDAVSCNIWFDPQLMQKILYNLISNALKFTRENGRITTTVVESESEVEIKVSDTGIGIDPEQQYKIFEDFYQIHNSVGSMLNNYTSGSGIGLSIVKKYVELHKSTISVDSVLNEGSTFSFKLKKGNSHFDPANISKDNPSLVPVNIPVVNVQEDFSKENDLLDNESSEEKYRILIVDDNPEILFVLKKIMEDHFNLLFCDNGKEAIMLAQENLPDLIISDIMMPEMDGLEMARIIKQNELTNHIPILFLTAKTAYEDVLEGLDIGACDYITKPFNEDILLSKINNLLKDRKELLSYYRMALGGLDNMADKVEEDNRLFSIKDPFIIKIVEYIQDNIAEAELCSESIERSMNVSRMQLYRKLKATTGLSVTDMIRKVRINKACELLVSSDLNVSEIAYDLGFSDPFYFSKVFKKEIGVSPLQYKKNNQGDK